MKLLRQSSRGLPSQLGLRYLFVGSPAAGKLLVTRKRKTSAGFIVSTGGSSSDNYAETNYRVTPSGAAYAIDNGLVDRDD